MKPGSERIGFAVAAAAIRRTLPGMLDVERRYGLQTGLKLHAAEPCTIMAVAAGSPADKARIRSGDVIVRLAGKPITSGADFYLGLIGCKPGQTLRFRVRRNGKLFGGSLTPAARPMPDGAALLKQKFGLTAIPLEQAQARGMALRVDRGVLITAVEAGLYEGHNPKPMPGDVLARIGDFRPRDLNHLGLLLERLQPGHPVQMVLLRLNGNVATRADLMVSPRS